VNEYLFSISFFDDDETVLSGDAKWRVCGGSWAGVVETSVGMRIADSGDIGGASAVVAMLRRGGGHALIVG
jgi:hypothetical protein